MVKPLIVYAEDMPHVRLPVGMKLECEGYDVISCVDGQEAYDTLQTLAAQGHKADLLLTDHNMPRMTGEELVRSVKKLPAGILNHDMPIIMMTTDAAAPARLRQDGIDIGYLDKSCTVGQLAASVRHALEKCGAIAASEGVEKHSAGRGKDFGRN